MNNFLSIDPREDFFNNPYFNSLADYIEDFSDLGIKEDPLVVPFMRWEEEDWSPVPLGTFVSLEEFLGESPLFQGMIYSLGRTITRFLESVNKRGFLSYSLREDYRSLLVIPALIWICPLKRLKEKSTESKTEGVPRMILLVLKRYEDQLKPLLDEGFSSGRNLSDGNYPDKVPFMGSTLGDILNIVSELKKGVGEKKSSSFIPDRSVKDIPYSSFRFLKSVPFTTFMGSCSLNMELWVCNPYYTLLDFDIGCSMGGISLTPSSFERWQSPEVQESLRDNALKKIIDYKKSLVKNYLEVPYDSVYGKSLEDVMDLLNSSLDFYLH